MNPLRDLAVAVRQHGAVITPEFLGADAVAVSKLGPMLVADLAVTDQAIAFFPVDGVRPHWQEVSRVLNESRVWSRPDLASPGREDTTRIEVRVWSAETQRESLTRDDPQRRRVWSFAGAGVVGLSGRGSQDGLPSIVTRHADHWHLLAGNRRVRLCVHVPEAPEERARIARWRRERRPWIHGELRELLAGVPRDRGHRERQPVRFRASWNARTGVGGELVTAGVLILGTNGALAYASPDRLLEQKVQSDLAFASTTRSTRSVFERFIQTGNGVTNEWSVPFAVTAPSIEVAASRLLSRLRFRDDPPGYLRELWLAGWHDSAVDVLREAEAIAADHALDGVGAEYLSRIRGAAAWARSGAGPAARRSTRTRGPRGRPRGGGDRAS